MHVYLVCKINFTYWMVSFLSACYVFDLDPLAYYTIIYDNVMYM